MPERDDPSPPTDLPIRLFKTARSWETWLRRNHARPDGLYLRIAKKAAPLTSVSYDEALDVALCWGWIDGLKKRYDEQSFIQRFTPRRKRSLWSQVNRRKVAKLIADGRMQPPGLAEVERARADGRWDAAYPGPRDAKPPPAFFAALEKSKRATACYEQLTSAMRFRIAFRIHTAKRAETKAKRIRELVAMLARGEKPGGMSRPGTGNSRP